MARSPARDYCRLVARVRRAIDRYGDQVFALAIGALYLAEIVAESGFDGDRVQSILSAIAFSAALVLRRRAPVVPMALAIFVIEFSNLAAPALAETGAFLFGLVATIYSAGRYARGRADIVCIALIIAGVPLAAIEPGQDFTFADLAFFVMFSGGPWLAGRLVRLRAEREHEMEERAAAAERARIARELHDGVAHALSVMVLQARGGRAMLGQDPGDTQEALDAIEGTGAQALNEMRTLLGLLDEDGSDLAPQPTLARLGDLATALRAAGLPVDVVVEGEPVELPPGMDTSAYRIVQEGLTNALKHAGAGHATVTVRYEPRQLELVVQDDGRGNGSGGGTGLGLAGLRERVTVYGGDLEAGPLPGGGYALRARLPIGAER
jgi:signal transduction histidine kinase